MIVDNSKLKIRRSNQGDLMFLYNLRNDPEVRKSAFNTEKVSLKDHKIWFNKKMNDKMCLIFIGELEDNSVGEIRFDIGRDNVAEIDIAIVSVFRRNGIAGVLLKKGTEYVMNKCGLHRLLARIRLDNLASQKLFSLCGFTDSGVGNHKGVKCIEMEFKVSGNLQSF